MNRTVSIARCGSYAPEDVKQALMDALSPIGGLDWVTPGMKIAVKVNMMMRVKPDKAATVHPQVACALCAVLARPDLAGDAAVQQASDIRMGQARQDLPFQPEALV